MSLRTIPFLLSLTLLATPATAQHRHGDHSQHSGVRPQLKHGVSNAARAQLAEVEAAVSRYRDIGVAKQEGWKKFGGDEPLMGEHWHREDGPDYKGSDARLDFSRPSNLMYTNIGGRMVLTGVAFVVRLRDGETLPEGFAGSADRWHVHDFLNAVRAATEERPFVRAIANWWLDANFLSKGDDRGRLAMVHAWVTLPNTDGPFADHNRLVPYLKLGLPPAYADGASEDAARGLDLATENGCGNAVDGRLWIADAGGAVARRVMAACESAAVSVSAALKARPAQLNAVADQAWREFDAIWSRELTPAQRKRIDAISEHGRHR